MWIAPALGFAGAALALGGIRSSKEVPAFAGSSLSAVGIIAAVTGGYEFGGLLNYFRGPLLCMFAKKASPSTGSIFI